jgi:hypothetical protein
MVPNRREKRMQAVLTDTLEEKTVEEKKKNDPQQKRRRECSQF